MTPLANKDKMMMNDENEMDEKNAENSHFPKFFYIFSPKPNSRKKVKVVFRLDELFS